VIEDSFNGLFVIDGAKSRRDFPGMLGMGMSYQISSKVRTELDFNYFFQEQADWGTVLTGTGEQEYSELAGNCWSLGASLIYQACSRLQLSGGFIYTKFDFQDIDLYYTNTGAFEVLYSDNLNLGLGFSYEILKSVKLNLGFSTTLWKDETIKALVAFPWMWMFKPIMLAMLWLSVWIYHSKSLSENRQGGKPPRSLVYL